MESRKKKINMEVILSPEYSDALKEIRKIWEETNYKHLDKDNNNPQINNRYFDEEKEDNPNNNINTKETKKRKRKNSLNENSKRTKKKKKSE